MRDGSKARRTAGTGMLFALALVFQYLESLVPMPFPTAPGIKLGLSNTVTMFCLFSIGIPEALAIAVLKGGFAFLTRGPAAGALSLAGGVVSVLVMSLMTRLRQSRGLTGVMGAAFHNLGQLGMAILITKTPGLISYLPVLLLSGMIAGLFTGLVAQAVLSRIKKG